MSSYKKGLSLSSNDKPLLFVAGATRLELATSGVTGRRSNQTELRPRYFNTDISDIREERPALATSGAAGRHSNQTELRPPGSSVVGGTGLEPVTYGL